MSTKANTTATAHQCDNPEVEHPGFPCDHPETTELLVPCDDRCMFAKGDDCDCECGGRNHKQGFRLPAHQREILRTKAGRRIKYLTPGTYDFRLAETMYARRQEGMTKKDIAAEFVCSAPTVRRLLTRFVLTMAALGVELEDLDAA